MYILYVYNLKYIKKKWKVEKLLIVFNKTFKKCLKLKEGLKIENWRISNYDKFLINFLLIILIIFDIHIIMFSIVLIIVLIIIILIIWFYINYK